MSRVTTCNNETAHVIKCCFFVSMHYYYSSSCRKSRNTFVLLLVVVYLVLFLERMPAAVLVVNGMKVTNSIICNSYCHSMTMLQRGYRSHTFFLSKISIMFSRTTPAKTCSTSRRLLPNYCYCNNNVYYFTSTSRGLLPQPVYTSCRQHKAATWILSKTGLLPQQRYNHNNQQRKLRNFAAAADDDDSFLPSYDSPHTIHYTMHSNDDTAGITIKDAIRQAQNQHNQNNSNFSTPANDVFRQLVTEETSSSSSSLDDNRTLLQHYNPSSPYCQQVGTDFPESLVSVYTPMQLLSLGSVWYLPAVNDTTYNTASIKPVRLNRSDYGKLLQIGDCLRIHYIPRRFLTLHEYDFVTTTPTTTTSTSHEGRNNKPKEAVILHEDFEMGFTVINKPPNVPVHMTVDNVVENVATAYGRGLLERMQQSGKVAALVASSTSYHRPSSEDNHHIDAHSICQQKQQQYLRDSYFTVRQTKRSMRRNRNNDISNNPPKLALEPVATSSSSLVYVTTPQRLDQNTTGLFVISTTKAFSGYFAKILRKKTSYQLQQQHSINNNATIGNNSNVRTISTGGGNLVHKTYKCLVCIQPTAENQQCHSNSLLLEHEIRKLETFVQTKTILTHYLEPSIRAPKFFSRYQKDSSWSECLLRITSINNKSILFLNDGTKKSSSLALRLWGTLDAVPRQCIAVAELEIELLTGRTHQIRGQLAAEGYPLVGDAQYGGALVPISNDQQHLALQCCELSFALPNFVQVENNKKGDEIMGFPTDKWVTFRLEDAWWTRHINDYYKEEEEEEENDNTNHDWQKTAASTLLQ